MVLSGIVAGWVIDLVVFVIAGEDIHSPAVHTAAQPGAPLDVVPSDGEAPTGNVVVVASRTTEYLEVLGPTRGSPSTVWCSWTCFVLSALTSPFLRARLITR